MIWPSPVRSTTLKLYGSATLVKLKERDAAVGDSSRRIGEYRDAAVAALTKINGMTFAKLLQDMMRK